MLLYLMNRHRLSCLSVCRLCRYELHIEALHLLDWYGGMHEIDVREYFGADPRRRSEEDHAAGSRADMMMPELWGLARRARRRQ